jgi:hypothetical protein
MTAWQYAYLHVYKTIRRFDNRSGHEEGPWAFLVEDESGVIALEEVKGALGAFNAVGKLGWQVQMPAIWTANHDDEAHQRVVEAHVGTGYEPYNGSTYAMRRVID